jgi:hypothetical protein
MGVIMISNCPKDYSLAIIYKDGADEACKVIQKSVVEDNVSISLVAQFKIGLAFDDLYKYIELLKSSDQNKQSKEQKLLDIVIAWRDKQQVTCDESIYQCDWVQHSLYELASKLLEVVGPYEEKTNDE